MIKTALFSLFAVFLFALGAAGAWFIVQYQSDKEGNEAESSETSEDQEIGPHGEAPPSSDHASHDAHLPVAVRGRPMSAEELFRFGAMNRKNIEAIKHKEEELHKEEMRVELLKKEIEGRKREVEGILQQTQQAVDVGQKLLNQLREQQQQLNSEKEQLQKQQEEFRKAKDTPNEDKQANLKSAAGWLQSMKSEDAAEALKELANDGKMDFALQLLANIEERNAAKILAAMKDPTLVADLTEAFRELKRPPATKRR
jgi:flagellar motility protein MotE (MotC chaperone)